MEIEFNEKKSERVSHGIKKVVTQYSVLHGDERSSSSLSDKHLTIDEHRVCFLAQWARS